MEEPDARKRKKIYVSENKIAPALIQRASPDFHLELTSEISDADIVVFMWDISKKNSYKAFEATLKKLPPRKDRLILFLYDQIATSKRLIDHPEIEGFLNWLGTQNIDSVFDSVSAFKEILDHWEISEASSPSRVVSVSVSAAPKATFFIHYDYAHSYTHSRQLRKDYADDKLNLDKAGENKAEKQKRLILLFAHYMSIRHVNSKLSRQMENNLAKEMMPEAEYAVYVKNQNRHRAFIRGKKYDPIARQLEKLLLKKQFGGAEIIPPGLNLLIEILRCVDVLEKGYFRFESKENKIKDTMLLAERVCRSFFGGGYGQPSYDQMWLQEMMKKETVRHTLLKSKQPRKDTLKLPHAAEKSLERWVRDHNPNFDLKAFKNSLKP